MDIDFTHTKITYKRLHFSGNHILTMQKIKIGGQPPPLGLHSYCKCNFCSNTLTTNIDSLKPDTIWQLLAWIKEETNNRGVSSRELLNEIREKMRKHVLAK